MCILRTCHVLFTFICVCLYIVVSYYVYIEDTCLIYVICVCLYIVVSYYVYIEDTCLIYVICVCLYIVILVLSYLPFFGIELTPIFWYGVVFHFFCVLIGSTADQTLCVILFIDTSKKKYTNTISFTDKTCAISDIDNINMIPD